MRRFMSVAFPLVALAVLCMCQGMADAAPRPPPPNMNWHYYKVNNACRYVEEYVRHEVELYYHTDKSIVPKLLRLVYSDCLVSGCDASILLKEGPNPERNAAQNRGLGGFVLIDKIKTVLESRCKGVVSCADILHLATRDAVHLAGGPAYPVLTGRKDTKKISDASSVDLPSPSISLQEALAYFKSRGLDEVDLTTLLGAHTLGRTHCSYIVDRLYNYSGTGNPDPSMDATLVQSLRKLCPPRVRKGQPDPLVFLNPESGSSYNFTESYYKRILKNQAVLGIDQQLLESDDTKELTQEFAAGFGSSRKSSGFEYFRETFAEAMYHLGNVGVLTGKAGEVRADCSLINK